MALGSNTRSSEFHFCSRDSAISRSCSQFLLDLTDALLPPPSIRYEPPRHQHGIVPKSANSTLILLQKWKYNPSKGFSCQTNSFPKMESLEVARQKRSTASLAGSCWLWSIVGTICCAQLPFIWGIQYRPGMKHQNVDSLSRMPCPVTCSLYLKGDVEDDLPTKPS